MERITATYHIETPIAPEDAAAILAGEQSSGTFVAVPGETEALKRRFAARVESVEHTGTVETPSIPGASSSDGLFHRATVRVSWTIEQFGTNLPMMVSSLQGNLYEIRAFTGLRLADIDFPASFGNHFRGPAYGVAGCRELTDTHNRPLIGTIIKPSVGLTAQETAAIVDTLAGAGIDFIKDDELMSSTANNTFEQRLDAVMDVLDRHADRTGKMVMYAFNISGEMDEMLSRYESIVDAGGTCAMVSINSVGLSAVKRICDEGALAIHGHRNGWGMLTRHPMLGMDFKAYQKIWRLAGVDQLHVNGIANKFWESDDSVVASMKACSIPLFDQPNPLPVVSSGQWGGQAFETWRRTHTTDLLYMAGGGIMAHPMGPSAGVMSIQQAWQAAVEGMDIDQASSRYPAFAAARRKFEGK